MPRMLPRNGKARLPSLFVQTGRARMPIPNDRRRCERSRDPVFALRVPLSGANRLLRFRPKRSKRSSVGSRCRGTISVTRSIEAALLQGIRSIAEWILDRSRHLAQTTTRPDEWSPALDVAQPRRACLEGRISYSDESASRSFRSESRVAC